MSDVDLLDRQGAFAGYGKVELIDGELLYVNAQYRPHAFIKAELVYRLRRAIERTTLPLYVAHEVSTAISEHDLPQPDIILTSAPRGEGPIPGDSAALLVEVADSTLAFDLDRKAAIYARAGVPEYWVADVNGRVIHQLWAPVDGDFGERREVAFGEALTAATIDGLAIDTAAL